MSSSFTEGKVLRQKTGMLFIPTFDALADVCIVPPFLDDNPERLLFIRLVLDARAIAMHPGKDWVPHC